MNVKRADLTLPDGWKVTNRSHVQVLDHEKLTPADLRVPGSWRTVERSPEGWWVMPADDGARRWLAAHGARAGVQSGCIQVHGQRLVPAWLQLPLPGVR